MKRTLSFLFAIFVSILIVSGCSSPRKDTFLGTRSARTDTLWYQPRPGVSWQWQLSGKVNTNYDVELYDIDLVNTPQSVIDELHRKGKKVICYFSAGTREDFRSDTLLFPKNVIGKPLDGWPDERWLDISRFEEFNQIIEKRFDLAVEKKCDGVEPDNVDGYANDTGFSLNENDQITYNRWLAAEAHKRNLSIALKNDLDQIPDLVDDFDFAINEQCFEYDECDALVPFIQQNKAVLGVEYHLEPDIFCEKAKNFHFSWLKMNLELDGGRIGCE